jgi:DNA polymerase
MITLDFETRSRCDLVSKGLHVYARDPSTEVLCVAWKFDDGPTQVAKYPSQELIARIAEGETVASFNAEFELEIFNNVLDVGKMRASQMRCSMARALACALPASLGECAKTLEAEVPKDAEGARLMRLMCKPDKNGNWTYSPEHLDRLMAYCVQDVEAEHAIDKLLPILPESEQALWELTVEINARGVGIDLPSVRGVMQVLSAHDRLVLSQIERATSGYVTTGKQVQRILAQFKTWGLTLNDLSKEAVTEALKGDHPPHVRRLLELRAEGSKSSVAKYQKMMDMCDEGRVRGLLRYHSASTGRYAGAGLQIQNLPRPTIKNPEVAARILAMGDYEFASACYPSINEAAASTIRSMLIADGIFLAADYSAIEARVLVWAAGAERKVEEYARGIDQYRGLAARIYGKAPKDITDNERQLGKAGILGAGFGMGAKTFIDSAKNYGVIIDEKMAKKVIDIYRGSHPEVVQFWYAIEEATKNAIRSPGHKFKVKVFNVFVRGKFLCIELPSGRLLRYLNPRLAAKQTKFGMREEIRFTGVYQGKAVPESTYGGKITENCIQATARDVMTSAMLNLKAKGFKIVLSVHDEIVVDEPNDDRYDEFIEIMETNPAWAKGLPTKVGAWKGKRYRK